MKPRTMTVKLWREDVVFNKKLKGKDKDCYRGHGKSKFSKALFLEYKSKQINT
jgi:hypothetical protein